MRRHLAPAALASLLVPLARAQEAPAAAPGAAGALAQGVLGLAAVLAAIGAVAWLARRFSPWTPARQGPLRVVATQSVGVRERVVLVEVGENWLVLGVAPGRVNALHAMPKGMLPAAPASPNPFARALERARGGG